MSGADIVIAVDALGPLRKSPPPKSLMGMIERYEEIVNWEINKDKVNTADIVITPDMGGKRQFLFKGHDKAAAAGYKATMEVMPRILELISWTIVGVFRKTYIKTR